MLETAECKAWKPEEPLPPVHSLSLEFYRFNMQVELLRDRLRTAPSQVVPPPVYTAGDFPIREVRYAPKADSTDLPMSVDREKGTITWGISVYSNAPLASIILVDQLIKANGHRKSFRKMQAEEFELRSRRLDRVKGKVCDPEVEP